MHADKAKKFLAIDHGDARIGLAVSDELGLWARPLQIIQHVSREMDVQRIVALAELEACDAFLVGVPYDQDGQIGPRARKVLRFVEVLKNMSDLQVVLWDESHSTQDLTWLSIQKGESRHKRHVASDDRVAALFLQAFLDARVEQRQRTEKDEDGKKV